MRRVVSWLVWWGLLFGLWLAFVGIWNDPFERIAGYCAAAVGATAAQVVHAQGLLRLRIEPRWVLRLWRPLARVPYEFAVVLGALAAQAARRRRRVGAVRVVPFPAGGRRRVAAGRRALAGAGGSLAPNAVVLDADRQSGELLVHELVPERASERPL